MMHAEVVKGGTISPILRHSLLVRSGNGRKWVAPLKLACFPVLFVAVMATGFLTSNAEAQESGTAQVEHKPAMVFPGATRAMVLGSTLAGERIVSVGDHGVILLSDDGGKSYRQARSVPTRATLNSVQFISSHEGWAVGQWGVVLHTVDGGDTWTLQRDDRAADRPLWTVWFKDANVGLAAGLWGLLLRTADGGKTWAEVSLPSSSDSGRGSDKNLFSLFPAREHEIFIAAERGTVFRSSDDGQTWREMNTGNAGTFWTGMATKNGTLLVAGVRGRIFRSEDNGATWAEVSSGSKSSITSMAQLPDGRIVAVGLDGITLQSIDGARSFSLTARGDRLPLTSVVSSPGGAPLVFSANGPVTAN